MISVGEARAKLLDLVSPKLEETVPLWDTAGRVLARDVAATRDQPPFAASSMDGYALKSVEAEEHAQFAVIGESAAGHRFPGRVGAGQAVRIFTGAPIPEGTDFVVIQENTSRTGDVMTITADPGTGDNIRPTGNDFTAGAVFTGNKPLAPADVALLAAMNISEVPVVRKPTVALIATGDELVLPGEDPGPDQIVASNTFGLKAMLDAAGAQARLLPVARDSISSLRTAFDLAITADLVVTVGGASVGDHDLVAEAAEGYGMDRSFYKVAMRPGKPLMAGRLGDKAMVGLPGNPVSALVCGEVFLLPMIRKMLRLNAEFGPVKTASLAADLAPNGPREHYMRSRLHDGQITAFDRQDSSLLSVLAQANALLIRPPNDPARAAGDIVAYVEI